MPDDVLTAELGAELEAALAAAGRGAAVSHELAAQLLGMELVDDPVRRLTVPRNSSRRSVDGWDVRRAALPADDVRMIGEVRLTAARRTVRDLCRVLTAAHAVVAADSALRLGLTTVEELDLGSAFGRGSDRLRAVGALLDPLSGSALESLLRVVVLQAGLPPPVTQHVIVGPDGRFVARVDFCWPAARLVVEADGFAFHSDRASFRADRQRLNELEHLGWRVLRFSWEDVVQRPEHVVALVRDCLRMAA